MSKFNQQLISKTNTLRREVLIGRIIVFNGILFAALGVYLLLQARTWQAYALIGFALEVSIGAWVGTYFIQTRSQSNGSWILFVTNLLAPTIAGLAISGIGLISAPYLIITSYLIIRFAIPDYQRRAAIFIATVATLAALVIEFLRPAWTLNSQLVTTIGPIFIIFSSILGLFIWFFRTVWGNLSIRVKLISSISVLSIFLIAVLTANSVRNLYELASVEELRRLTSIYESYNNYIATLENTAASLALSIADRQDVIALHRARDRQGLLDLLTPIFNSLKQDYDIVHMYIEDPDGTVFVRIHNPANFGDDITYRRTAEAALRTQQLVAGVEIGPGRLGVRGVAPLYDGGQFVGMAEVGVDYDQAFIDNLKANTGVDYTIWVSQEAAAPAGLQPSENAFNAPISELFFYSSTNQRKLSIPANAYTRVLLLATPETHYVTDGDQEVAVMLAPLLGYGERTIGVVEIISPRAQTLALIQRYLLNFSGIAVLVVVVGFISLLLLSQIVILRPINILTNASRMQLEGNLAARVPALANDEFGELGSTLNSLSESLQGSVLEMEERVVQRTADLEVANQQIERRAQQFEAIAQVSRVISSIQNLEELLPRITRMISQHFGFYHTGVFLLDDNSEFAVLRAANSEGGQKMLERGHRLEVGQTGIVGHVTSTGNPRIALETGDDAVFFDNPDLPETRSEMALPLKAGSKTIGALDVQSTEPNAFSEDDINILSALADQVSVAIQNVTLYGESRAALAQAELANRQLTGRTWEDMQRFAPVVGYRFDGTKPEPLTEHTNDKQPEAHKDAYSVPIQLRGVTIGRLRVNPPTKGHKWSEDETAVIRATAERVALASENARLVLDSQKRASKEKVIGEISTKISAAINLDNILQTTLREMGRILPGADISIQVENE